MLSVRILTVTRWQCGYALKTACLRLEIFRYSPINIIPTFFIKGKGAWAISNVRFWHEAERLKHCQVCDEREADARLSAKYHDREKFGRM